MKRMGVVVLLLVFCATEADAQRFRGRSRRTRGRVTGFRLGPPTNQATFNLIPTIEAAPEVSGPQDLLELYISAYFGGSATSNRQSNIERLGELIFEDPIISFPVGQSCAECHGEDVGFASPNSALNGVTGVLPGAVQNRFGTRRPPGLTYLRDSTPVLSLDAETGIWSGGVLLDGRGTGLETGDPLAQQHAFLRSSAIFNDAEQNAPFDDDSETPASEYLVQAVINSNWTGRFIREFGEPEADTVATALSAALAAFLRQTDGLNEFNSKFDRVMEGEEEFTEDEAAGFALFNGAANCAICHSGNLFTGRGFVNIGVPINPTHPSQIGLTEPFVDLGLGETLRNLGDPAGDADLQDGAFKVPTLRNAFKVPEGQEDRFVKSMFHNGAIRGPVPDVALQVVQFYNRSQTEDSPFGPPEVPQNVTTLIGDLGLTEEEELQLVAFLLTLTDEEKEYRGFGFGRFRGRR